MPGGEADTFLIDAVQRGDARAWREVIDRYQGRLINFARRMLANPGDAEDIVQETFVGLLRSLPNYDRRRALETYLFAILRNKLSDHFRKAGRGQPRSLEQLGLDDGASPWVSAETPSRHAAGKERLETLRSSLVACLREWVEQCQAQSRFQDLIVVEMLMVLGMRNKEVASDLGLTETSVAGVKFRVLEQWRKQTARVIEDAGRDWDDADLARDSTVARIWREEGISCPKRSTLGRYLLGALERDWEHYVEFHVKIADCDRCNANIGDLRDEDARDARSLQSLRERCFASSVGFLSHRPSD